ncbi:MPEG1-like protein [Mya arenaria]|uniref:MPEG1-like protein n=1 Tax=Mya arenaria TaxID=6604 RepID=A0ABY7EDE5_MYAAR|nr:MPEG1-like protein [Mya arenaria]
MRCMASVIVAVVVVFSTVSGQPISDLGSVEGPYGSLEGHPAFCKHKLQKEHLLRLEPLPGQGWDNLQNEERNMVVKHEYASCKTTADERFLIPDGFNVYPVKSTHIRSDSEVFEHWNNFTSSDSQTINSNAGINLPFIKISGKYSKEYEITKSKHYREKTESIRQQIGKFIMDKKPDHATWESQLLVREYGTHVVTGVELGASVLKVDRMNAAYSRLSEEERSMIKYQADLSFKTMLDDLKRNKSENASAVDMGFTKDLIYSKASAQLYTELKRITRDDDTWLSSMDENQVPLDRSGNPLFFYINDGTLPDVPFYIIDKIYNSVKEAVISYYEHNVVRGCTNPNAPNFNFLANFEDETCDPPMKQFEFGGAYQTCTQSGCSGYNHCSSLRVNNPRTGAQTCPDGFEKILLAHGTDENRCQRSSTYRCGWWSRCTRYYYEKSTLKYSAYWCAPVNSSNDDSIRNRYLFGGTFTTNYANPVTQTTGCPPHFDVIKLLGDLSICVSTDVELGSFYSLHFGGFHTCLTPNPFLIENSNCPDGYSQHLSTIRDECQIDVCLEMGQLKLDTLPNIQVPPFMRKPIAMMDEVAGENTK